MKNGSWTQVAPIICVQEEIGFHPIKKLMVKGVDGKQHELQCGWNWHGGY